MYQKWNDGTTVAQLEKETNLSKESIYKRFGRLRKHKDDGNVTVVVESHVQDRTDTDTPSIMSEETNADIDTNENIHTVSNHIDDEYKISTMSSEQETKECQTAIKDTDISKTGFVDGRIVAGVIIVILFGIIIGLYGPQIWSALKGIKSKMREKITGNHERHLVSEYDNSSYCVETSRMLILSDSWCASFLYCKTDCLVDRCFVILQSFHLQDNVQKCPILSSNVR